MIDAVVGMAMFGAKIGYDGKRLGQRVARNAASAALYPAILEEDLDHQLHKGRLTGFGTRRDLPPFFFSSPLGLVNKTDGKMRRIHNLSFPIGGSVNDHIKAEYGTITYSTIEEVVVVIQRLGRGTVLMKRDFEEAFRQIPVAPADTPLLGFCFKENFFTERFLPFGLRTSPYLFNLFAEVFHWVLERELGRISAFATVIHYLDDFLVLLPPGSAWEPAGACFLELAEKLGLAKKEEKNEEGSCVSFGGVEVDTARMVIRIPNTKRAKGVSLLRLYLTSNGNSLPSISLFELQQLTGFLNFIVCVVPLGRAFLRRLYNMQLFFPPGQQARRRISAEALKDIRWWLQLLEGPGVIERQIVLPAASRTRVYVWSDAAGSKGLGGYFLRSQQQKVTDIAAAEAFSSSLPRNIQRMKEHINTKEMRAVEQCLLHWGSRWRGMMAVLHIDNQAVVYGIHNRSIRGRTMDVLRRCLLHASRLDIELEALWIPTKENGLADALSRFDRKVLANIAPQLSSLFSRRTHGFRTFREPDLEG